MKNGAIMLRMVWAVWVTVLTAIVCVLLLLCAVCALLTGGCSVREAQEQAQKSFQRFVEGIEL